MGRICSNCGYQLKEGARFCNKCGQPVVDEPPKTQVSNNVQDAPVVQETPVVVEEKKSSGSTLSTVLKVIVGLAVVFFAASALFGKTEDKGAKQEAASASVKQEQSAPTGSQQKSISTDSAESALASFGIKGKINNSTFGNSTDGFMANVDNKIYVVDLKNKQVASVENYSFVANELNKNRSGDSNSGVIIPQFLIFSDKHGKDDDLGEWRGDNHFLPIYILIKHDSAGNVKVDGKMSSGHGAAPSHYQGYLKEQKNIDLADIFMKQIVPFMGPLAPVATKPVEPSVSYPPISRNAISGAYHSSADNEDGYNHSAALVIDGDIKTCWAKGVPGLGIGENILIEFNGIYKVSGLSIWTGHQKTQDLFYKNARPTAIRVIGSDGSNEVYMIADRMGGQRVDFRKSINVKSIKIVVESVARGNKYEDTCIGEIVLY